MDRNQAWPGEPPSQLAATSTHELFGSSSQQQQQQQQQHQGQHQQQHYPYQQQDPNDSYSHQFASEAGVKKAAKRNRNALSCAECRRLKLKCSRIWPCTSCVKRKCAHICPDDVLKEVRPSRSKEVGALQGRIRELEATLAQQTGNTHAGYRTRPQSPTNASSSIHDEGSYQSYEPYNVATATDANHQPGIQDVAEVMGTLLLGDDGSSRYLGKSAANALFHEDGSDDGEGSAGSQEDQDDLASTFSGRFQAGGFPMVSRGGLDVEDFQAMLPPLPEGQRLANAYYTNCAYMFEPLRRDSFEKYLAAAYTFNMPDPLPLEQLACVFIIMALGVSFDLETEFRDPQSTKYHNIAQACLTNAKFLNVPSLASIQCLHLMSTWQLTTHSQTGAFRAWPLLGLAGRMVLSTGIHRDGSIWAIPDPHLTIRRQLFWELASYDRFQGLILGRPYMLNSKHFDTLMPEGGSDNSGESIEYHRAKWQFSLLVGELCDECLSVGRPGYDTILLHDRKIRTFKENLPNWLRFDPQVELSQPPPEAGSREFRQMTQRHALVVMIHETLLFLHRVAFANAIENYPAEPLRSPWAQSVVSLCLEAARTLIGVTRAAFHSYPKLAARWWLIQIHCFGAATCLAAVCIKAPASALTRLAWAELCDAVNLLENQVPEGGHARDLAPRLKRLREQAQLKLDAYQQSIISSNYPGISGNYDINDSRAGGGSNQFSQNGIGMGDSPPEDKLNQEDDKLAVLGTATRVLEGKLRQNTRNHSHNYNKHSIVGTGGTGITAGNNSNTGASSSKSGNSPYGSLSGLNPGSASSTSTSYPYAANLYSPTFGQQQLQGQSTGQTQQQTQNGVRSTSGPVYSASTPTAQTLPFAMGKGAMPVNIGCVDQSLADLLAEVSSPGRDPTISGGTGTGGGDGDDGNQDEDDDDSAMMYFNMPSGNTPVPGSSKSPGGEGGLADSAFSTFSFSTGRDGFKAPRNPLSSSNNAPISLTQNPAHTLQSGSTPQQQQVNNSSMSSSSYTALPDAGVSPSSGLDFGTPTELGGISTGVSGNGGIDSSGTSTADNSGGSSFLSSIPGLMASPNASSYGGYTPDGRRSSIVEGMPDVPNQSQQQRLSHGISSSTLRTTTGVTSGTQQQAYGNDRRSGSVNEDSYLDTAWMDYFPTPGVGLFPQSTGLLFGASSGTTTPNGINPNGTTTGGQLQGVGSSTSMLSPLSTSSGRGSISYPDPNMQYQQQAQQQQQEMQQAGQPIAYSSPTHQQQQQMQMQDQQAQQQQRNRYLQQQQPQQPGPGGNNMNNYRVYDDLFGSVNNRY